MASDAIQIGYVARAHGLRGELRVHLHAAESTTLLSVDRARFAGAERRILAARPVSGGVLVLLEGVTDRDAAEALRGAAVEVERSAVPLEEGEYLLCDLPGCLVVDEQGGALGRVVEVISAAQPILVIHDDASAGRDGEAGAAGTELLLPAVPEFVLEVDVQARRLVVAPPEGLQAEPRRR